MRRATGFATFALLLTAVCVPARAGTLYEAFLDGPSEAPPNASPGTGYATLLIDTTAHTFSLDVMFSGLIGNTTASHIHGPTAVPGTGTAGVATTTPTFPGFPLGVTSGSYSRTFDMTLTSTWNPTFVTNNGGTAAGAEAAFVSAVSAGKAYLNIHSSVFPGGEIRGFFHPVPEPSSWAMAALGGIGLMMVRRRLAPNG